jgi:hypothetical protein
LADDTRLALLEERREKFQDTQVNNSALPAGADMYYYCKGCGVKVDQKPEGWWQDPPPPNHCKDCTALIDSGVIDHTNTYREWLGKRGKRVYW